VIAARIVATTLVLGLAVAGCATPAGGPGGDGSRLSDRQIGLLLHEASLLFSRNVVATADEMGAGAPPLTVRRNALLWKMNAVPTIFLAASQEDPRFAVVDLWILAVQMHEFLSRGRGTALFGASQAAATETARRMEENAVRVARRAFPQRYAKAEQIVTKFAAAHPIESIYFIREPVTPYYLELLREETGLFASIARAEGYAETATRLALFAVKYMPEIARWQVELTLLDAEHYPVVAETTSALGTMARAVGNFERLAIDLPKTLESERRALLEDADRQRRESFRDLERMRHATFQDVSKEREATLAAVRGEREALLAAMRDEVSRTLDQAGRERAALAGAFPEIATRLGASALPHLKEAIDHLIIRIALLLAVAGAICVVAWVLLRRTPRSPGV
jgi:hypothetical protein